MPRFLKLLLVFLLVTFAVRNLAVMPPIQRAVQAELQDRLAEATKGSATIGQVRTNLWNYLEIHDLRVLLPRGRIAAVALDHGLVEFSPWRFLFGRHPLGRLAVDHLILDIRDEPGAAIRTGTSGTDSSPTGAPLAVLSDWLPRMLRLAALTVREAEGGSPLDSTVSRLTGQPPALAHGGGPEALVQLAGAITLEEQLPGGDGGRVFEMGAQGVRLHTSASAGRPWNATGRVHLSPDVVELTQLEATSGAARLAARGRLDTVVAGEARLDVDLPDLWRAAFALTRTDSVPVEGTAEATLDLDGPLDALQVTAGLDLRGAAFNDVLFDESYARLSYRSGALLLDSLRIDVGQGWLAGRGRLGVGLPGRLGHLDLTLEEADASTLEQLISGTPGTSAGVVSGFLRVTTGDDSSSSVRVETELAGRDMQILDLPLGPWRLKGRYVDTDLSVALSSEALRLRASGRVRGLGDHEVRWRLDLGDEEGLRRITGVDLGGQGGVTIQTRGSLRRPEVRVSGELRQPRVAQVGLDALVFEARLDSLRRFGLSVRDRARRLRLRMAGDLSAGRLDEGRLTIAGLRLAEALRTADAALWHGVVTADLDFSGSPSSPEADGTVLIDGLGYSSQPFGEAVGSLSLSGTAVRARISALDSALVIAARVQLTKGAPFTIGGWATGADLSPFLTLAAAERPGVGGVLSGRLEARGRAGEPDSLVIVAQLAEAEVHTPRARMSLAAPVRVTVREGVVQVEDLVLEGSGGHLSMNGSAVRGGAIDMHLALDNTRLAFIEPFLLDEDMGLDGAVSAGLDVGGAADNPYASGFVTVTGLVLGEAELGLVTGRANYRDHIFRIDELALDMPRGRVLGDAELAVGTAADTVARQGFAARVELAEVVLDSQQGLPPGMEIHATGRATLGGRRAQLSDLTGTLDLARLELRSPRYRVVNGRPARMTLQEGHLASDSLRFTIVEERVQAVGAPVAEELSGALRDVGKGTPKQVGEVLMVGDSRSEPGLQVRVRGLGLEPIAALTGSRRHVTGLVDADLSLLGRLGHTRIRTRWAIATGSVDSLTVEDLRGRGTYADGDLAIDEFAVTMAGGQVRATGRLPLGASRAHRPLGLNLSVNKMDLAGFRRLAEVESEEIEALTGRLSGELSVSGTPADPVPRGTVTIEGGELAIRGLRPTFGVRSAQVKFTGDSVRVSGVGAGDGSWNFGARAALEGLRPSWFRASVATKGLNVEVLETMSVTATGTLIWEGTPDRSTLTGRLQMPRGEITEPMSLRTLAYAGSDTLTAASSDSGWGWNAALDVRLEGRNQWLRNDLVEVPFEGELGLSGTAARPVVTGEIRGLGGTLNYLDHVFALESSAIRFNSPAPLPRIQTLFHIPRSVDPEISLAGATELTAKNGNEYSIRLGLTGRLSALVFALVSDPPQEQMDVLSLLAFGEVGVPMMDDTGIYLKGKSSLSPSYLLSATEDQFGRILGLDDVTIDSSVLRPGRLSGSRIVLSKQLSEKMEMTYSTSVGYAAQGRVQLQYDLGRNMYLQTEHDARGESGLDLNLKLRFK